MDVKKSIRLLITACLGLSLVITELNFPLFYSLSFIGLTIGIIFLGVNTENDN